MTPESPYAPPQAPLTVTRGAPSVEEIATMGQRFAVFLIDSVVTFVLRLPVTVALAVRGVGFFGILGGGVVVFLVYYVALEWGLAATPGKLLLGLRVVSEGGGRAGFRQIAGRTLARMIPFEPFSFLNDKRPVGWHDSLSRTRVIRAR